MTESVRFLSSVEHIMNGLAPVVPADTPVTAAREIVEANSGNPVAVVGPNNTFKGMLTSEMLLSDSARTAGQVAVRARMTAAPHESAFSVVSRMLSRRVEWVPVLKSGQFVGSLSRRCVMSAFGEVHSV